MRISESMIRYYLDTITVGYFNDHDLPPDDVSGYEAQVREIERKLAKHGDAKSLRLAFAYLLHNEALDLEVFNGGRYPFDDEEMREMIRYCYEMLFPGVDVPREDVVRHVEIVEMPVEEWWEERGSGRQRGFSA